MPSVPRREWALSDSFMCLMARLHLKVGGQSEDLGVGQFAYIPPDMLHEFTTGRGAKSPAARLAVFEKRYQLAPRPPLACGSVMKKIFPATCFRTIRAETTNAAADRAAIRYGGATFSRTIPAAICRRSKFTSWNMAC